MPGGRWHVSYASTQTRQDGERKYALYESDSIIIKTSKNEKKKVEENAFEQMKQYFETYFYVDLLNSHILNYSLKLSNRSKSGTKKSVPVTAVLKSSSRS